jgi:hypothetical protein
VAVIGDLVVRIVAQTDKLTGGLSKASGALRSFGSQATGIVSKVTSIGAAIAGIGGGAGLAVALNRAMSSLDRVGKTADRLGVTTEALIGLQHAASLAGVDADAFDTRFAKLTKNIAEAASGIGPTAREFEKLGLSAEMLSTMSPDQAFIAVADAIGRIENPAEKVRASIALFGRGGEELIPLFNGGATAIRGAVKEAAELGMTVSRVDASAIEAANDAVTRMEGAFQGVVNTLAVQLAPAIEAIAKGITKFGETVGLVSRNWEDFWSIAANNFSITMLGAINDVASAMAGAWEAGKVLFRAMVDDMKGTLESLRQSAEDGLASAIAKAGQKLGLINQKTVDTLLQDQKRASKNSGESVLDRMGKAFYLGSKETDKLISEATAKLREENKALIDAIVAREKERLQGINPGTPLKIELPKPITDAGGEAITRKAAPKDTTPQGLLRGSREALDKFVKFRNTPGADTLERQVARNTQRTAAGIDRLVAAIEDAKRDGSLVVGAFS